MLTTTQVPYSGSLERIAEGLDIPPSKYQQAVERYKAVGDWLDPPGSSLHSFRPRIHPQGSFRLGTVVRPIRAGKEADYDIDLVCQLQIAKHDDRDPQQRLPRKTAKELKQMVGDRLKENSKYQKMLHQEGKRCWTLEYAEQDDIGFHMDILPSAPEERSVVEVLEANGVPFEYAQSAIGITDKDKESGGYAWVSSNPEGYGQWFDRRVASVPSSIRTAAKQALFETNPTLFASVEDVPDALVRTPLQRAIQILKRHRDIRFAGQKGEGNKPISMIITTLAALLYEGEADVQRAVTNIVARLKMYARLVDEPSFVVANGASTHSRPVISRSWEAGEYKWHIGNPVDPLENFADRWHENDNAKAKAFFQWVTWAQADLIHFVRQGSIDGATAYLSALLVPPSTRPEKIAPMPEAGPIEYPRVEITNPSKPWSA